MPGLSEFPTGGTLFLDANIFLEHLLRADPACTAFFQRLHAGEIRAVTSTLVLTEVRHRLLLTEATRQGYVSEGHRALELLRARPETLRHLGACDTALNLLLTAAAIRIVSVTKTHFRMAQRLSLRQHLLTNDAMHLAVIRAHRIRHLASADKDFRHIPRLTLWQP